MVDLLTVLRLRGPTMTLREGGVQRRGPVRDSDGTVTTGIPTPLSCIGECADCHPRAGAGSLLSRAYGAYMYLSGS